MSSQRVLGQNRSGDYCKHEFTIQMERSITSYVCRLFESVIRDSINGHHRTFKGQHVIKQLTAWAQATQITADLLT